jgi:small-conductance mechanosensitive channel/CRP-like cAMP-binding protein
VTPSFDALAGTYMTSAESLGLCIAVSLVAVLYPLLPRQARGQLRQPVLLLALHLGTLVAARALPEGAGAEKPLSLLSLTFLLASIGRSSVLLVLDVVLGRRMVRPLPRIIRDLTQGIVYVVVLLLALRSAGVEPGSLLTTSALLTAVIALSLQETLGNMVAGLAIQVQHPFDVDDWIQFDSEPKHIGRVIEINWRATKIITLDEVEVVIPNATLAKAAITNFTKPTLSSRRSLYVQVPAHVPPHVVHRVILDALTGSFGVLREPSPSVVTNALVDPNGNIEYWVRFFTDQFHKRDGVDGTARDRIWYALSRAGISLGLPNRSVRLLETVSAAAETEARLKKHEEALRQVDFLGVLSDEQRRMLATQSEIRFYIEGEVIVHQGDQSAQMFIVDSGEVAVERKRNGPSGNLELARLGQGKFFGEMALMTGEPRAATVRALDTTSLIAIDHRAFRSVLESAPDLATLISRVIAERQAVLAGRDAVSDDGPVSVEERSSLLLGRIRKFFAL